VDVGVGVDRDDPDVEVDEVRVDEVTDPEEVRVAVVAVAGVGVGVGGGKKPHCDVHVSKLRDMLRVTLLSTILWHENEVSVSTALTDVFPTQLSPVKKVI
jgi:hypothetical protein